MIGSVSYKYAARSLLRHPRRTILSMIGVGIGCGIGVFATSWVSGSFEMQLRAVSESGGGHIRIVPDKWLERRENSLRLNESERVLAEVRATPGVRTVAARARANGLLAMGGRSAGVQVVGVQPEAERASNRIVSKARIEGRYLAPGDAGKTVIGKALARKLDVELDDELHVTLVGRDEMQSAMLTIVGLLETGSRELDSAFCHVTLADIAGMTGYAEPAEVSLLLQDYRMIDAVREDLAARIPAGNVVITWQEVNPEIAANARGDLAFTNILIFIIIIVVALGISSAQLTAVLERRREFGMLMALGMKGRQVGALMAVEAVLIGLGGSVVALITGGSIAYWLSTTGVSLAAMLGDELSFGGVLLEPVMYGSFGTWIVWYALAVSMGATLAASIYPARFAMKTSPADALRVG